MVRCAMCFSPATSEFFVLEEGMLSVCDKHYQILYNLLMDKLKADWNTKMKNILTRIIDALNKEFIEIESYMGMPPMKRGKYMGKREGLKIAISEVEKELEALIKK